MFLSNYRVVLSANRVLVVLLAAACALCLAPTANAALVTDSVYSWGDAAPATLYDGNVLADDLINGLTGTTTGWIGHNVNPPLDGYWGGINDGTGPAFVWVLPYESEIGSQWRATITYGLDTVANPLGYTLETIRSIYGHASGTFYVNQAYDIDVSYVGSPSTFVPLATVNYRPISGPNGNFSSYTSAASQVTLTDTTGELASGVAAVRISFSPNGTTDTYHGQTPREFDVIGSPTQEIPEPSTLLLLTAGLVGLLAYAWRKRR